MFSMTSLPPEWAPLPEWVRRELAADPDRTASYARYVTQLVAHGENMKPVWKDFEGLRSRTEKSWSVFGLLRMLHGARCGTLTGFERTGADRRALAGDLEKHANKLLVIVDRLGLGAPMGAYPLLMAAAVDSSVERLVADRIARPVRDHASTIGSLLRDTPVSSDLRRQIRRQEKQLVAEIELDVIRLLSDPREMLRNLAAAAKHWAFAEEWRDRDTVWHIASAMETWFGHKKVDATATLATALLELDVTVDQVKGILRRPPSERAASVKVATT